MANELAGALQARHAAIPLTRPPPALRQRDVGLRGAVGVAVSGERNPRFLEDVELPRIKERMQRQALAKQRTRASGVGIVAKVRSGVE